MNIEKIEHNGEIIALIIRKSLEIEGVKFFTPEDFNFQLGVLQHKAGTKIKPHIHKDQTKLINCTQEVLYVTSGNVQIDLYNNKSEKIKKVILKEGDVILFASGGHGLKILEDTRIVEVKQGPYAGVEKEKEFIKE